MKHITIVGSSLGHARAAKAVIKLASKIVDCSEHQEVAVIFINDRKMRTLNKRYRHQDKTTNVLAFEGGDIFISLPEARREARKYGWSVQYSVARLALHGFLHLLGYDHVKEKEARRMEKIERRVLSNF